MLKLRSKKANERNILINLYEFLNFNIYELRKKYN